MTTVRISTERSQQLDAAFRKPLLDRAKMLKVANMAMFLIKQRIAKGEGLRGPFKPYTPAYARFRKDAGRSTDKVNLFFTGRMIGGMQVDATDTKAEVFFLGEEALKAMGHHYRKRPFFALKKDELDRIRDYLGKMVGDQLNGR